METRKIFVMTKGADSVMMERTSLSKNEAESINDYLHHFACAGLRTLVMAQKTITENEFKKWFARFERVSTSNSSKKEALLGNLYSELEHNLTYVGSSAIEDLL